MVQIEVIQEILVRIESQVATLSSKVEGLTASLHALQCGVHTEKLNQLEKRLDVTEASRRQTIWYMVGWIISVASIILAILYK